MSSEQSKRKRRSGNASVRGKGLVTVAAGTLDVREIEAIESGNEIVEGRIGIMTAVAEDRGQGSVQETGMIDTGEMTGTIVIEFEQEERLPTLKHHLYMIQAEAEACFFFLL